MCRSKGRDYVGLGDENDERLATADRARGHARAPLVLNLPACPIWPVREALTREEATP